MNHEKLLLWTLCSTLFITTVGILFLMASGKNVAAPVSLAVVAQWGALLHTYKTKGE